MDMEISFLLYWSSMSAVALTWQSTHLAASQWHAFGVALKWLSGSTENAKFGHVPNIRDMREPMTVRYDTYLMLLSISGSTVSSSRLVPDSMVPWIMGVQTGVEFVIPVHSGTI